MENHTVTEFKPITLNMFRVYTISLIVVGSVGNILLILTILYKNFFQPNKLPQTSNFSSNLPSISSNCVRKKLSLRNFRLSSADYLLFLLTICDFICLWILVLRYAIFLCADIDIRTTSSVGCPLHTYLSMTGSNLSLAFLCIFSTQRAISICWPLASLTWLTRRRLNICILVAIVSILIKHTPVFYMFRIHKIGNTNKCDIGSNMNGDIYYYVEFATHTILGYLILVISNLALCIKMSTRTRIPSSSNSTNNPNSTTPTSPSEGTTSARLILTLSLIQVITSVPFFIIIELGDIANLNLVKYEHRLFAYYVCILAMFTNMALNYFIILLVSQRFRESSRIMIVHLCKRFLR